METLEAVGARVVHTTILPGGVLLRDTRVQHVHVAHTLVSANEERRLPVHMQRAQVTAVFAGLGVRFKLVQSPMSFRHFCLLRFAVFYDDTYKFK